jgi:hypothetical protein
MNFLKRLSSSIRIILCLLFILIPSFILAVQLDNWRLPYYTIASRLGYYSPSPSGMFWDDMGQLRDSAAFLDRSIWPDGGHAAQNHWILEPAGFGEVRNTSDYFGKNSRLGASLLNDIRYRGFLTRQVVDVDSRYLDDPGFIWVKNRGVTARIGEAFLQYGFKYGFVRIGRMNRNWGPFADRSLIFSANPYSYDGIELGLHSSFFEFRHFFAAFPDRALSLDLDTTGASRYLSAHSLNFLLGRFGSVGITESIVFGRKGGFPDLQYVNPVAVYFVNNTTGDGVGNLMEALQWNLHPFTDKVSLKGQLLIDDIQIDNKGPGDQKPNHWGADLGVFWSDFLPITLPHALSLEYRFLSRWVYTASDDNTANGERYIYLGKSLGFPTNDGDSTNLSFTIAGKNYWASQAGLSYKRQGQGTVLSVWHDDSLSQADPMKYARDALGYRIEPSIPSGIVESAFDFYINLIGYYKNYVDVQATLHNRWVTNKGHVVSSLTYDPQISVSLGLHYSNFFIKLPQ